jgi:hypothetical protein
VVLLPLYCFLLENHVCLSRDVQVVGATLWTTMRIMAGVGDLLWRTAYGRTGQVLGGRAIERSGDAMCGLYRAQSNEEHGFLG